MHLDFDPGIVLSSPGLTLKSDLPSDESIDSPINPQIGDPDEFDSTSRISNSRDDEFATVDSSMSFIFSLHSEVDHFGASGVGTMAPSVVSSPCILSEGDNSEVEIFLPQ